MNDCSTCRFKENIPGTHHIACNVVKMFVPEEHVFIAKMSILQAVGKGESPFKHAVTGEPLMVFNQHGVDNGWCYYPLEYDKIWVTCNLPLETLKSDEDREV